MKTKILIGASIALLSCDNVAINEQTSSAETDYGNLSYEAPADSVPSSSGQAAAAITDKAFVLNMGIYPDNSFAVGPYRVRKTGKIRANQYEYEAVGSNAQVMHIGTDDTAAFLVTNTRTFAEIGAISNFDIQSSLSSVADGTYKGQFISHEKGALNYSSPLSGSIELVVDAETQSVNLKTDGFLKSGTAYWYTGTSIEEDTPGFNNRLNDRNVIIHKDYTIAIGLFGNSEMVGIIAEWDPNSRYPKRIGYFAVKKVQ